MQSAFNSCGALHACGTNGRAYDARAGNMWLLYSACGWTEELGLPLNYAQEETGDIDQSFSRFCLSK